MWDDFEHINIGEIKKKKLAHMWHCMILFYVLYYAFAGGDHRGYGLLICDHMDIYIYSFCLNKIYIFFFLLYSDLVILNKIKNKRRNY